MSSPKRHFNPNEEHIWGPILLELARKRCTISTITGKFKCGYQTLAQNDSAMEYVRLGWAEHDEEVLDLILAQAKDDPMLYEESVDRTSVRNLKASAIKTLYTTMMQVIPPAPAEVERVKRLTDEELAAEITKIANAKRNQ